MTSHENCRRVNHVSAFPILPSTNGYIQPDRAGDVTQVNTHDSVKASYADLKFEARIVVSNLAEIREKSINKFRFFEDACPKARGWLGSYLPGYSKEGNEAIVRAGVGPSAHGAMITAVLEKSGDKWVVKWYHISRYS